MTVLIDFAVSGAGTVGGAEVGAYLALEEVPNLEVERSSGVSAGSIIAALIAIGKTGSQIRSISLDADYGRLINESILNVIMHKTICSSGHVIDWLKEITNQLQMKDVIIPLKTVCTDVVEDKVQVWDSVVNEDMFIWEAIYSSMAIPFVFPPYENRYVDGGTVRNIPVQYINKVGGIGVAIKNSRTTGPLTNPFNTAFRIISMMLSDEDILIEDWAKKASIPVIQVPSDGVGFLDRNMTIEQKTKLIDTGYSAMKSFLTSLQGKKWIKSATVKN